MSSPGNPVRFSIIVGHGLGSPVFSVGFHKPIIPAQGVPGPFSYGSSGTAVTGTPPGGCASGSVVNTRPWAAHEELSVGAGMISSESRMRENWLS